MRENIALACCHCNRYKGPNLASIDPESDQITPLFHPREHVWEAHFRWNDAQLMGLTGIGRATIRLLQINRTDAVAVRGLLMQEGVFVRQPMSVHDFIAEPLSGLHTSYVAP